MNKWRKPDSNEDPFDLSMETLLQRAEEEEQKNRDEMQELLLQTEKEEKKHSIFRSAVFGQQKAGKLLLALGLVLVIGLVSGGIESYGGFQVGIRMQKIHGASFLKGDSVDRYESNDINLKLQEISEQLDSALLQIRTEQSVVCTRANCDETDKIATLDVQIGREKYAFEIMKTKESTSLNVSKNMDFLEEIKLKGEQTAIIYSWKDSMQEQVYYAYLVKGSTMIMISAKGSLKEFQEVLQMLTME